jgi:hypothetical protein
VGSFFVLSRENALGVTSLLGGERARGAGRLGEFFFKFSNCGGKSRPGYFGGSFWPPAARGGSLDRMHLTMGAIAITVYSNNLPNRKQGSLKEH